MKTKFRDLVIIVVILAVAGLGFFMFRSAYSKAKYETAVIYYSKEVVAVVNFKSKEIKLTKQSDAEAYPKLDLEKQTITVLGAPQDGIRYEVTIKYDFTKQSMQITDETSPNNICSKYGEQNSGSILCVPNAIEIIFKNADGEADSDGSI